MKRPLTWMLAVFVVLLAVVAALRRRRADDEMEASDRRGAAGIRAFWEAYNGATQFRLEGDYSAAAALYRDALALDPDHQDSLFYLATSLEGQGRYADAVNVLKELLVVYPEHSRAWSQLGTVLATRAPGAVTDLDAADDAFRRSQAINSEHTGPFVRRGQLALARGELDEARELFALASDAGSPEATFLAGVTAYLAADFLEASSWFIEVIERSDREMEISGRGASSEGDVEGELTPLARARVLSEHFLYWTAHRLGGYPEEVPEAHRKERSTPAATFVRVDADEHDGRGALVDLNRDGEANRIVATRRGLFVDGRAVDDGPPCWDVVPLDFDEDGWMDLYVVGSGYTGIAGNRLLRNEHGQLVDVTESRGLAGERPTTRVVAADFDGDGAIDLLEAGSSFDGSAPVRLYLQRDVRFVRDDRGLSYGAHAVDAAVADIDGDGRLDVFILGWKAPGKLSRNAGESFEDVTNESGFGLVGGNGLSALFSDVDGDDDPDLIVFPHAPFERSLMRARSGPTVRFFRNDGRGRFEERTTEVGLDRSFGVMQAVASDVDDDGFDDLVLALGGLDPWQLEPSVVLRNENGKWFSEWAFLPSPDEPTNAVGVAVSGGDILLPGIGVFRRKLP